MDLLSQKPRIKFHLRCRSQQPLSDIQNPSYFQLSPPIITKEAAYSVAAWWSIESVISSNMSPSGREEIALSRFLSKCEVKMDALFQLSKMGITVANNVALRLGRPHWANHMGKGHLKYVLSIAFPYF